jgi:hypothetical protein
VIVVGCSGRSERSPISIPSSPPLSLPSSSSSLSSGSPFVPSTPLSSRPSSPTLGDFQASLDTSNGVQRTTLQAQELVPIPPLTAPLPGLDPSSDPHTLFLSLTSLPTTNKPIFGSTAKAFEDAAERMAIRFTQDPSDRTLLDFLALPKVGLAPALKGGRNVQSRLAAYPLVDWPVKRGVEGIRRPQGTHTGAWVKQIEQGKLSRVARMLADDSKVLQVDAEVLRSLQDKHPRGEPEQAFTTRLGPPPASLPSLDSIPLAMASFKRDTAPGISGWTHHLLSLALRRPLVLQMVHTLIGLVLNGTAPGQSMLCASRLTPLAKPDGGVRPIAVGELLYRLCVKVILRHTVHPNMLLPTQFGVGTSGGVEPMIRAIQHTVDGTQGFDFTQVTSLDFKNAFNTLDRADLASGLARFAPSLYRTGRWAYGTRNDLVLTGETGELHLLKSSQGVRQGDPFGPLFFSLGVRSLLDELAHHLGPSRLVLAYLDDVYILSNDRDTLGTVQAFFHSSPSSLQLNMTKSKSYQVEDIRRDGIEVLGSCIGDHSARASFLKAKIEQQEAILAKLVDLPHQHALLLLRECLQQNLRHLLRSLHTGDLQYLWARYDAALQGAVSRIRSAASGPLSGDSGSFTNPTDGVQQVSSPQTDRSSLEPLGHPHTIHSRVPTQSQDPGARSDHLDPSTSLTPQPNSILGPSNGAHQVSSLQTDRSSLEPLGHPSGVHSKVPTQSEDPGARSDHLDHLPPSDLVQHAPLSPQTKSQHLISLPSKMGGLGILSMLECAPLAYAAAAEASDRTLHHIPLIQASQDDSEAQNTGPLRSQRERCQDQFETRHRALMAQCTPQECLSIMEASSYLGRRWMSIIPFNNSLRLSDFEVSNALHLRTLLPGHATHCHHCGLPNELTHHESCRHRPKWTLARHEQVKYAIADGLKRCPSLGQLTIEPYVPGTQLRTDLKLSGSRQAGTSAQEFDITIVSLSSSQLQRASDRAHQQQQDELQDGGLVSHTKKLLDLRLERAAKAKRTKYSSISSSRFRPLVFSSGGAMEGECRKVFEEWRSLMTVGSYEFLLKRLSLLLLRARFRHFEA